MQRLVAEVEIVYGVCVNAPRVVAVRQQEGLERVVRRLVKGGG